MRSESGATAGPLAVVIPNLNGGSALLDAVGSLYAQTLPVQVVVVDNASSDGSVEVLQTNYPDVVVLRNRVNLGYAGGVNPGMRLCLDRGYEFVGVFNDDAIADRNWAEELVADLRVSPACGAATSKVLDSDGVTIDSVGDCYTAWGLAFPRGRGEVDRGQYDGQQDVFGASGAACVFRADALRDVGLFDESFFAYFEDVDLSFRLQLAGWGIRYVPSARVLHARGMTSAKMHGFVTYQTMKNLPLVAFKNMPWRGLMKALPILTFSQIALTLWAIRRGQGLAALRGSRDGLRLILQKRGERQDIQGGAVVGYGRLKRIFSQGVPPDRPDLDFIEDLVARVGGWIQR